MEQLKEWDSLLKRVQSMLEPSKGKKSLSAEGRNVLVWKVISELGVTNSVARCLVKAVTTDPHRANFTAKVTPDTWRLIGELLRQGYATSIWSTIEKALQEAYMRSVAKKAPGGAK